jgi:2-polyprenyl-3-methyl-5-hydroxy-6-metoxy-1,4-benzoquinol methylase/uncharacterized protein YbaR (Trm112 family)
MIKEFLLKLLRDPIQGSSLIYQKEKKQLVNEGLSISYPIEENVPIILPSDLSKSLETEKFDYAKHYKKDAQCFDYFEKPKSGAMAHENKRLHQIILSQIDRNANIVLDIGCGNAWLAKNLCPKNIHVISVDISTINPKKAQTLYPFECHQALVADAHFLPLKPNSIDCIIASEIVEHVPYPKKLISHFLEKLKPGGNLIVTTPYNEVIEQNLCIHCHQLTPRHAHLHSFNERNISQYLPEGVKWKFKKFNNKYLTKLKTHILFKYLPLIVWKGADNLANFIFPGPSRFMLQIKKS